MLLDRRCRDSIEIARPRLEHRLLNAAAPIRLLVGPAGSGKSELLRACYSTTNALVFRAGNSGGKLARFVSGLAMALAPIAPGAQASFARAWERALQAPAPGPMLAQWLCEHLAGSERHIVIDDLHDGAADARIAAFLSKLADLRPAARLTLAVRDVGVLPVADWLTTRRMERPIDAAELRFDRSDVVGAVRQIGITLDTATLDAVIGETGGFPIAVAYALSRLRADERAFSNVAIPASFDEIAQAIFARRNGHERAFLLSASLFPTVDDDLLRLGGWDDAAAIRTAMGSDAAFIWEPHQLGSVNLYDRFRDYLVQQLATRDADVRRTIAQRTVRSLCVLGRYGAALDVAIQQHMRGEITELLDAHGFAVLESGGLDVISEALAAFDDSPESLGAQTLALRGYLEARSGRSDTAEAWFALSLAKATDVPSRAAIAMYYARELALRRREDACDVLAEFADATGLPHALLVDVRSSFAQALVAANRLDEAVRRTDEAVALLEPETPPALRARVLARAAYVAVEAGDQRLARERAAIAAPLAQAQALYDVAASTYSVLYNISYEVDDDAVASATYLRCVRDLGAKSGNLRLDLYAMLGLYALAAETGDEPAMTQLDSEIAAADKHEASADVIEALLPAKALQAAWTGNFGAAHRLLQSTAERQATLARKALCYAQIALYAAADGQLAAATAAAHIARDALARDTPDLHAAPTIKTGLTLLTLGLAAWAAGEIELMQRCCKFAAEATIGAAPRLRALRDALDALSAPRSEPDAHAVTVCAALNGLRIAHYGGMAKLIEALPARLGDRGSRNETIADVLAHDQLSARFAVAIRAGDAASLNVWLDTLPGATIVQMSLNERFERWVAAQREDTTGHAQAAIGKVRRQIGRYRPAAPAFLRLGDDVDIDASIDALIDNLEVAAPLMAEHSRAVSAWCSRLARALGLSNEELLFVTRCGLIHDVGKTQTPTEILHAPRQLSTDEWAIMRDHAAGGARIIERLPILDPFIPIVRGHHERLDGKGYPDGLRLSAIPRASRIVAVADCFNAMIGRRSYRLPLSPTAALEELQRHRETQFDPEVVEAMVRVVLGRLSDAGEIAV